MSKEIVEKKKEGIFESINKHFEEQIQRMEEFSHRMFDFSGFEIIPTVKMNNIDDFKSSIEKFQKENPDAKVKASAYAYSTGNEPQMFKYESKDEVPKLPKKQKKRKQ